MSIKKIIKQLEKFIELNIPQFEAKFYINRQNFNIHLGLDKSLFSIENYKELLDKIDKFLGQHLVKNFESVYPPKLILSTKWKHDYIVYSKLVDG